MQTEFTTSDLESPIDLKKYPNAVELGLVRPNGTPIFYGTYVDDEGFYQLDYDPTLSDANTSFDQKLARIAYDANYLKKPGETADNNFALGKCAEVAEKVARVLSGAGVTKGQIAAVVRDRIDNGPLRFTPVNVEGKPREKRLSGGSDNDKYHDARGRIDSDIDNLEDNYPKAVEFGFISAEGVPMPINNDSIYALREDWLSKPGIKDLNQLIKIHTINFHIQKEKADYYEESGVEVPSEIKQSLEQEEASLRKKMEELAKAVSSTGYSVPKEGDASAEFFTEVACPACGGVLSHGLNSCINCNSAIGFFEIKRPELQGADLQSLLTATKYIHFQIGGAYERRFDILESNINKYGGFISPSTPQSTIAEVGNFESKLATAKVLSAMLMDTIAQRVSQMSAEDVKRIVAEVDDDRIIYAQGSFDLAKLVVGGDDIWKVPPDFNTKRQAACPHCYGSYEHSTDNKIDCQYCTGKTTFTTQNWLEEKANAGELTYADEEKFEAVAALMDKGYGKTLGWAAIEKNQYDRATRNLEIIEKNIETLEPKVDVRPEFLAQLRFNQDQRDRFLRMKDGYNSPS